jgi:predicted GNAT family acetyltransferase
VLSRVWGAPRAVREEQPLLVLDRPIPVAADPSVRLAAIADLERYMAASAAMCADELGVSPYVAPGVEAFRARVVELITSARALASFDHRGQVVFKADVGVVSPTTAQIQGVWVRPDLRGRGVATAGMATVVNYALTLAPSVSLYVNDFNAPARRVYAKLGMRRHATLATVLL